MLAAVITIACAVWSGSADQRSLVSAHPDDMWVPFAAQGSTGHKNERIDDNWSRENIVGSH